MNLNQVLMNSTQQVVELKQPIRFLAKLKAMTYLVHFKEQPVVLLLQIMILMKSHFIPLVFMQELLLSLALKGNSLNQ
jgi:hypothetical protein